MTATRILERKGMKELVAANLLTTLVVLCVCIAVLVLLLTHGGSTH